MQFLETGEEIGHYRSGSRQDFRLFGGYLTAAEALDEFRYKNSQPLWESRA
ncbi:hypothetical protein [Novipirellula herctigrandis]|uniref:hypothetical protein n=1 Tax=Novipirellula herctigrandis TaxID=2527986 RepID=UPI003AF36512